jgi:DNA-binding IclR family transcriptional regulator
VAAIDLSAHTAAISVERLADGLRSHLVAAADRISARLGFRRDDEVIVDG